MNLFKIACINYLPNPVSYQGKMIPRRDLISLQKVVSDMAIKSIESTNEQIDGRSEDQYQTQADYSPDPERTPTQTT